MSGVTWPRIKRRRRTGVRVPCAYPDRGKTRTEPEAFERNALRDKVCTRYVPRGVAKPTKYTSFGGEIGSRLRCLGEKE